MIFLATITTVQVISIILVLIALYLGFKILETNWSYTISKPHAWDAAVKSGKISKKLKKAERSFRDKVRFYNFWFQIERLKSAGVPGAFAEVGVYQGETANIIHAMDPSRTFHLFDTFKGFDSRDLEGETKPENEDIDFSDTDAEAVRELMGGGEEIVFHAGYFPETTKNLAEQSFAFVHLDADLYPPTMAALKYFYPRLSPGGIIIIHDYNHNWQGVRKALEEFMPAIPETLVEIPDWQGSAMIVRDNR
jgi:O-methyltransferase